MPTTYIIPDNDAHWHALRARDITSTEASALFNMSPYATLYELWQIKSGAMESQFEDNERIQAGRIIEPAIAALVAERYGVVVEPFKAYATDTDDRIGSSFDYRIIGVTDAPVEDNTLRDMFHQFGVGILEAKNVDGLVFKRKWLDDETPAHIEIQLQHQLELSGHGWGAVCALVGGNRLVPYVRERDVAVGRAIRAKVREFWKSIETGQSPPIVYPDDADVVIALHQFSDGSVLDLRGTTDHDVMLAAYDDVKAQIKALEENEKVLKASIMDLSGEAGSLLWSGGKIVLTQTKGTPGKVVTPEMVGTTIGGRKGYRMCRSYPKSTTAQEGNSNE